MQKYSQINIHDPISKFDIRDVPGDNSCMFHAISKQLHHYSIQELRNLVANSSDKIYPDFQDYVKSVRDPSIWGNDIALAILAKLLKITFIVYRKQRYQIISNMAWNIYSPHQETTPNTTQFIYLYNDSHATHFMYLVPKTQFKSDIEEFTYKLYQNHINNI